MRSTFGIAAAVAALLWLSGCSFQAPESTRLLIGLPGAGNATDARLAPSSLRQMLLLEDPIATLPSSLDAFNCYIVNVSGPGINSFNGKPASPDCKYPGILSSIATVDQSEIEMQVPSGAARNIQILGLISPTGVCDFNSYDAINGWFTLPEWTPADWVPPPLPLEIGQATTDLFADATVEIQAKYPTELFEFPFNCPDFGLPKPNAEPSPIPSGMPSMPEPVQLQLVGAWMQRDYMGIFNSFSSAFPTDPDPTLPLSISGMPMNPISDITAAIFSASTPADAARMDFAFDTLGLTDLAQYSTLMVKVTAWGGTGFTTSCAAPGDVDMPFVGLSVISTETGTPAFATNHATSSSPAASEITWTSPPLVPVSNFIRAYAGSPNGNLIYASLQTKQPSTDGRTCARIELSNVEAWLMP